MQGYAKHFRAASAEGYQGSSPFIVFDFDGTLCDSMTLCIEELRATYRKLKLPLPSVEILRRCNGPTHEGAIPILGLPEAYREDYLAYRAESQMELMPHCVKPFPKTQEMIRDLHEKAPLLIATNADDTYVTKALSIFGIADCFAHILSHIPGLSKAQLLSRHLAARPPARGLMAGDRGEDISTGKENGLTTVAACYGFGKPDEWAMADHTAPSVEALWEICLAFILG